MKAGVAINPGTAPSVLEASMDQVDLVLSMTVDPGFGGHACINSCLDKISVVREMARKAGRDVIIELDGGIKLTNLDRAAAADVLVMGSAVFQGGDPEIACRNFREAQKAFEEIYSRG